MHVRFHRWMRPRFWAIAVLALGLVGCGSGKSMVDVSGTITYQGKPIDLGNIRFEPFDKSLGAEGDVIKDGVYHVKLPLGKARVSISGAQKDGEKKRYNTPDSPMVSIYKDIVPKKYNTLYNPENDLSCDITGANDRLNFDLK